MKTYKLNPLEKLQLEKKQLREECKIAEQRMVFQLEYIADNWGAMIARGITSSIKNKFSGVVENFTPSGSSVIAPYISKPKTKGLSKMFSPSYKKIVSMGWGIVKPMLWTYATKKVTSMIFSRKKRK